jgi:uncharacterized protein (UPF0332 family)
VKLQSNAFLEKARELLEQADANVRIGYADVAGRTAYLAGYHAAQALIFEHHGRVFKTHKGVRSEFARLVRGDPQFDTDDRAFLGRTYNLKSIADYETGPGARVTNAQAALAIVAARRLVDKVEQTISS